MTKKEIKDINDNSFDEILSTNDGFIVVAFVTEWCKHCKAYKPVYDEANNLLSDIDFYTCDMEKSPDSKTFYDVSSMPSTIVFFDGKEMGHLSGGASLEVLLKFIEACIEKSMSISKTQQER